jgi:hypothetical protein
MKRDLDLIRDILLDVENWSNEQPLWLSRLEYEGKTKQDIGYQLELLKDAGHIEANIIKNSQGLAYDDATIVRMKMAGHGYLDTGKFAKLVGVSVDTLERWDKKGLLKAGRTLSGRRMYTADDVKKVVDTSGKQETK